MPLTRQPIEAVRVAAARWPRVAVLSGMSSQTRPSCGACRKWSITQIESKPAAEDAGFDSIWVMDHFRQAPQLGRVWDDMPESTATLGHLAAATRTASIGCLVNGITYPNVAH